MGSDMSVKHALCRVVLGGKIVMKKRNDRNDEPAVATQQQSIYKNRKEKQEPLQESLRVHTHNTSQKLPSIKDTTDIKPGRASWWKNI